MLAGLVGVLAVLVTVSTRSGGDAANVAGSVTPEEPSLVDPTVSAWATVPFEGGGRRVSLDDAIGSEPAVAITVDATAAGAVRTWRGVGAALTDASVQLLTDRDDALSLLFDPARSDGAGLDLVRLPFSATDFSMRPWTWSFDRTTGSPVVEPTEEARAALAVLDDVASLRPDVSVVATAWTSPPEMRSDPSSPGGALVATDDFGELLSAQVDWLLDRGVPLSAVSLGNEPGHVGDSPTLAITDEQMIELSERLGPRFDRVGIELLALDHNWSDAERAVDLVRDGDFDAVAFHCYDGDPAAMAMFDVPVLVTECTATTGGWHESVGWMARELVGDAISSGSTGLMMWNLALDPSSGPKASGGCGDCRGLVTVDPVAGTVEATPELAVVSHLSAAADPGASILAVARVDSLPLAVFWNPDGSLGVFGHNDRPEPLSLTLRVDVPEVGGARSIQVDVPSWAVFSIRAD